MTAPDCFAMVADLTVSERSATSIQGKRPVQSKPRPGEDPRPLAVAANLHPVAIVLNLVNPFPPG
jgi:hypothetical protein